MIKLNDKCEQTTYHFILHNIEFEYLTINEISLLMISGLPNKKEIFYIFTGFSFWHSVTATINSITLEQIGDHGVVIYGGDTSKRHLVSPMSIKFHTFLFNLAGFDRDLLVNNVIFNIDKKFIIPQFNFQEMDHPRLGIKRKDSVDKKKRNKNNRNLHTDFKRLIVTSEEVNENEESLVESIANSSILPIPATQPESIANPDNNP